MKICTKCGESKPFDEFNFHPQGKNKLSSRCKRCKNNYAREYVSANRESRNKYNKTWRDRNPEKVLARRLRNRYNTTLEQYNEILHLQGGVCAICKLSEAPFVLDHDHGCCNKDESCGRCVRGILCRKCNAGLGMFSDDIDRLEKAINYIKEQKS